MVFTNAVYIFTKDLQFRCEKLLLMRQTIAFACLILDDICSSNVRSESAMTPKIFLLENVLHFMPADVIVLCMHDVSNLPRVSM